MFRRVLSAKDFLRRLLSKGARLRVWTRCGYINSPEVLIAIIMWKRSVIYPKAAGQVHSPH